MKTIWKDKRIWIWLGLSAAVLAAALRHQKDVRAGAIESGDLWLLADYRILTVCAAAFVAGAGYWFLLHRNWRMERCFVPCCLCLGTMYLFVLAPLSAPDEVSHYISAYKLSNQIMGKPAADENGLVYIRAEDAFLEDAGREPSGEPTAPGEELVLGKLLNESTYRVIHRRGIAGEPEPGTTTSRIWTVKTTPVAYVPQALGITLARLLSLGGVGLLYLGRFFNLLFFTGMTCLAMRKLPFGKEVLFGVSLLPMTLHLAASMSYDTMILALSFYFTAHCLDLACARERVRKRDVAALAVLAAALIPCKMVYGVLLGLCLLIPVKKFGGRKPYLLSAAVVFAAFSVSMVLVNTQVIAAYTAETSTYVGWAEEEGYGFGEVIHNQGLMLNMLYNTLVLQGEEYFMTMLGAKLGGLDEILNVPFLIVAAMGAVIFCLSLSKPGGRSCLGRWQRLWIAFLGACCFGAVLLSMLVAYTPKSSKAIDGVQGRYFLPLLPMLLLAFRNDVIVLRKNMDRTLLYLLCCGNAYALLRLFGVVSMRL